MPVADFSQTHTNKTIPEGKVAIELVPQSQANTVVVIAIAFLTISWFTVLLRFWTRRKLVHSLGWDDWTMGITIIFFSAFCAGIIKTAMVTCGKDFLDFDDLATAINFLLVTEAFYILTMLVLKISLAIFFLRIIVKPWQKVFVYVSVGLSSIFNVFYFFFTVFQCGVPSSPYLFFIRQLTGQCITRNEVLGVGYAYGGITIYTDVMFAVLPAFILRDTNMNVRERWTVGFILILAAIGGVASMVRMDSIQRLATPSTSFFAQVNHLAILSTIEPGLGIIAGSLATLRPLFRNFLLRARTYTGTYTGTEKSASRRPSTLHSQGGNEAAVLAALRLHKRGASAGTNPGPIPKRPWRPVGRRSPTTLQTELQVPPQAHQPPIHSPGHYDGHVSEAYDGVMEEVPVMKHPSTYGPGGYQQVMPFSPRTPFTPNTPVTESDESPILGYSPRRYSR